ncbi:MULTISPECIES: cytochrome c-type biogenesis protein [unclassified Caballeronia]|uniref:cytochrome c-type biogenesis protein n=1 Tax=unclassified Caballeronia TaxID=2646786 RepID=UPI00286B856C|nr:MULTISPECIES: cytochrome c-type biogenesis protein [unclassified Caballeronia]
MIRITVLVCVCLWMAVSAARANDDDRLRQLAESFRCVVCQNQSLADSAAPLAADLRERIREQARSGASDEEIRDYMVRRYGDFVLYRPPMKPATWALWFGPLLALLAGAIALALSIRRARRAQ